MNPYYFLFALAILFTLVATIQDIKKREVANWLNYSLIAFSLAYLLFYSIYTKNSSFFLYGAAGFIVFFILANILYYAKAFAGGDAKLLMGLGTIFPYTSYFSIIPIALIFCLLLFLVGAFYSLLYSIPIAITNKKIFSSSFSKTLKKYYKFLILTVPLLILNFLTPFPFNPLFLILFLILPLYIYTSSIEKCLIKLYPPSRLTEGDWILSDIKLKSHTVKKTVHGLSKEDIKALRKANKSILVKEGIPFIPAFLISLIIMVFFSSSLLSLWGAFFRASLF